MAHAYATTACRGTSIGPQPVLSERKDSWSDQETNFCPEERHHSTINDKLSLLLWLAQHTFGRESVEPGTLMTVLRSQPRSYWNRVVVWTLATGLAIALPARLVHNDFFRRMTPTRPLDYAFWIISSVLIGLIVAFGRSRRGDTAGIVGGTATLFAVGCPVCNKLVVALIGTAGALDVFAPIQPVLGTAAIALLVWSLHRRARLAADFCAVSVVDATP